LIAAARNNAEWCDLVCRTHDIRTAFTSAVWFADRRTPLFYPDAVTLAPDAQPGDVLSAIDTSPGCSVKDSFATLDLTPYGFHVLFDAQWIERPPTPAPGGPLWSTARTADDLRPWPTTFRPALLDHPDVAILAADGFAAGAIANRSATVVGLSNLVAPTMPVEDAWRGAVATIVALFPGLPVVGYERPADLRPALSAGFVTTGPLRVWIKD
jgi:hypothetical protein